MKKIAMGLIVILALGLIYIKASGNNADKVKGFLDGIVNLEGIKINSKEPIKSIKTALLNQATKTINLNKSNIKTSLDEAKQYKTCILIAGNYTIVKITDFNDCKQSTSWATCMPEGEGYLQKDGSLNHVSDQINNIIGKPGTQNQIMCLFQ